jgi:DNA mismatch repair protein MutL
MSITTRIENDQLGTRIEVRYGKLLKVYETGCNKGTVIEIKDLFGNLPARKKFLKSPRTELFHIEEIIKNYSLANYQLGITYTLNNNRVLDFAAATDTLEERIIMLYTKSTSEPLVSLQYPDAPASTADGVIVKGFLLSPEQTFSTSSKLRLFVNGRAVKDRMMAHAVHEGLSGYLMKGRTAGGVVFVTVPYESVDVNVHPTKQEIRFQQPNRVHDTIVSAVQRGMENYQQAAKHTIFGSNLAVNRTEAEQSFPDAKTGTMTKKFARLWNSPSPARPVNVSLRGMTGENFTSSAGETAFSPIVNEKGVATAEPVAPFLQAPEDEILVPEFLKPIGQFMDLYLLCEAKRENESYLVVIDQHAVHERILLKVTWW